MDRHLAVGLSLASSVLFAWFSIVARKGLGEASPYVGAVIGLAIGIPILGGLSLVFSDWSLLSYQAALWFVIGGILAPGFSRFLLFLGFRTIGVGRTMPLVTITPFLSTLAAIAWLGEEPGLAVWVAIFFVMGGCLFLTMKPEGDADWRRAHMIYPLLHAVVMAIASTLRRYGLLLYGDPLIGATIANVVSLPTILLFAPALPASERFRMAGAGLKWFVVAGVVNAAAYLAFFSAFQYGEVFIVMPLSYTAPLFALAFARVWLGEEEKLTWQKWAGGVLLFFGAIMIAWGSE